MTSGMINEADLAHVVRVAPLVSIDVIMRDDSGAVLVARRNNEPAKGAYFVPGGAIRKNERIADAFARILVAETGVESAIENARLLGVYEHFYSASRFTGADFGTHYVVLGYEISFDARPAVRLDKQHSEFRWLPVQDLLSSADVHDYVKTYFRSGR